MIFHTIDFELSDDDKKYIRETYLTDRFTRRNKSEQPLYYTGFIIHLPLKIEQVNQLKSS